MGIEQGTELPSPHGVVGVGVHPLRLATLLEWLMQRVATRRRTTVMYANAYAVNLAYHDAAFRDALNRANVVFCDGYGVWFAAQLLGVPLPERFTPPDWVDQLATQCAARGYHLFLLGAKPGVAAAAAERLLACFPQLRITTRHGYFDVHSSENDELLRQINAAAPDILLVGMGMPRQELWIQENMEHHTVTVVIAVGALFDYLAGPRKRGPRWLTDAGGEWLWRLAAEPRRLWRRYLLGNPLFLWRVLHQYRQQRRS